MSIFLSKEGFNTNNMSLATYKEGTPLIQTLEKINKKQSYMKVFYLKKQKNPTTNIPL